MGIQREYECKGHGVWETDSKIVSECPWGCQTFQRVFTQSPGYISPRTRGKDRMQKDISRAYGLTDMSNRNGDSIKTNEMKRYPRGAASIALPSTPINAPGTPAGSRKTISLSQAIASSGAFENNAPAGVVSNAFQSAHQSVKGTRRQLTNVFAACDSGGNPIRRAAG